MPAPNTTPEDGATLAIYWFAKLAAALEHADFILANEASEHLRRLGFEVRRFDPRRRQGKGGASCKP